MDYKESVKLIHDAMFFREQKRYNECITLMQDNLSQIDPDVRLIALIQIFGAAKGKGDDKLTRQTAREISRTDAELPSIQNYL